MIRIKRNIFRRFFVLLLILFTVLFILDIRQKAMFQSHNRDNPGVLSPLSPSSKLSYCKFIRSDQGNKQLCRGRGSCEAALPYTSNRLLTYFEEASQKTGVPADLLAAVARIESTTKDYTIVDYTDQDIEAMENGQLIKENIDATIPGTKKAVCPRSVTGALGHMQLQPPEHIHNDIREELIQRYNNEQKEGTAANEDHNRKAPIGSYDEIGAHDEDAILRGAEFAGITRELTREDFCHPKTNLYLSAGFILKKLQRRGVGDGTRWDPRWTNDKRIIDMLIAGYYGCLKYPDCNTGPYNYGDDVYNSMQACNE